jgi:hypothetical protein
MNLLRKNNLLIFGILAACALVLLGLGLDQTGAVAAGRKLILQENQEQANGGTSVVYMPLTMATYPTLPPFGAESNAPWLKGSNVYTKGIDLNLKWTRMIKRISWKSLQPTEGSPIDWTKLAEFEQELIALRAAGITPVVIISDSPYWATVKPTSCAAIKEEKFSAFEAFMRAVVTRYMQPKFNVHNWEIGNEPDVDPSLVKKDSVFGCWGNVGDKYYGGEQYGKMLKVIGSAVKQVDPTAKVWFGGLLLASPNSSLGKPELFLKGALEAGAGPYFDIVGYHWYPPYLNQTIDHDLLGRWKDLGGGTIGKARFLRDIMNDYGLNKPLVLNETSLMCPPTVGGQPTSYCNPPQAGFYQMQANYEVRSYVRGLSVDLIGFSWYTLDGPGWRNTGLLDSQGQPRPSYLAMKHLIAELQDSKYLAPVDYGAGLEAYAFQRGNDRVHVIWAIENSSKTVSVPIIKFTAAFDRDGKLITPTLSGSNYILSVGFKPIYIILKP